MSSYFPFAKSRFDPHAITAINGVLDSVESAEDAAVLVTTNEGKFYSNGMDAKYLIQVDTNEAKNLASRLLCFSIPTVAIVRNVFYSLIGHVVGAGCMFALPHDYRLMSSNHGFIFINEVEIGMSLTPRNSTILGCKLSPAAYHNVVLTSRRYDGSSATKHGLVHDTFVLGRPLVLTTPLIFSTVVMSYITGIQATVKDLPDVEGDRLYGIKFRVFWTCVSILLAMYFAAMVVGATSSFVWTKGTTTGGSHLGFRPSEVHISESNAKMRVSYAAMEEQVTNLEAFQCGYNGRCSLWRHWSSIYRKCSSSNVYWSLRFQQSTVRLEKVHVRSKCPNLHLRPIQGVGC
eukprot:Gb_39713 [translate_table: standard]